jgi:hypothetical protein
MSNNDAIIPAWVAEFRTLLRARGIPSFSTDYISVLSDYSGQSKERPFRVQSFLLFNPTKSPDWPLLRQNLRASLPDRRRFAYKALSPSSHLQSKLQPFLAAADSLNGWCVTIAVHKSLKSLVSNEESYKLWKREGNLQGTWNPQQFENMLRIVHFLSVVLAEIMGNCNCIEWVSDQDEIFANDARCLDATKVLKLSLGTYVPNATANLLVGTSVIDTGHRGIEDLLAIPDLAAGAVADFASARETACDLPKKAMTIGKWLRDSSASLSKCSIWFRPERSSTTMSLAALEPELIYGG